MQYYPPTSLDTSVLSKYAKGAFNNTKVDGSTPGVDWGQDWGEMEMRALHGSHSNYLTAEGAPPPATRIVIDGIGGVILTALAAVIWQYLVVEPLYALHHTRTSEGTGRLDVPHPVLKLPNL